MFLWSKSCWILLVCNVCCFMNNLVCWRDSVTKLLWSSTSHKRLDFDTPLSSITTLIPQSPLPSRPHSWLPCTNRPYFILGSSHFLSPPSFSPPSNFPPSHPTSPMPIQLHKIQLYRLWYLWQRLWRNVRPTSQCWAVSPAALFFCSPWRQRLSQFFAWRLIFSSTFLFSNL